MPEQSPATDLRFYLSTPWRRKFLILPFVVITPVLAYFLASSKPAVYQASAEVLLGRQAIVQSLSGIDDPTLWNPDRLTQTQAELARVPEVARRVLAATDRGESGAHAFLAASDVVANENTDLLTFVVRDRDPGRASELATEYARQYIRYRVELDTMAIKRALDGVEDQIAELRAEGERDSPVYTQLIEKQQQLTTAEALQASSAFLVRPSEGAAQVEPRPTRNAGLALVFGLIVGLGLAFVRDALDTRIRSADDIAAAVDLPLLARLPAPTLAARRSGRLVMLSNAARPEAESYRILRTNLEFTNLDRNCRAIMVTSAVSSEGKSTTAANLAVAMAMAGRRVVLVDLDLRRPVLDEVFETEGRAGATEVALGRTSLDAAMTRIPLPHVWSTGGLDIAERLASKTSAESSGNGRSSAGHLELLTAGRLPPNPGEFVTTAAFDALLGALRDRSDVVVVDGPPMLLAGETLALSAKLDGLLLVARAGVFSRTMVPDVRRFLAATPAAKLGVVVTGTPLEPGYGYYQQAPRARRQLQPAAESERT